MSIHIVDHPLVRHKIALLRETRSIPIVFATASDPVGDGFVASLARPGGNATGFTNSNASMGGKWLELIREVSPGVTRAAILFNRETAPAGGLYFLQAIEGATRLLPDIDWSERWRDGLGPRVVGRLTITPSWAVGDADERRTD